LSYKSVTLDQLNAALRNRSIDLFLKINLILLTRQSVHLYFSNWSTSSKCISTFESKQTWSKRNWL